MLQGDYYNGKKTWLEGCIDDKHRVKVSEPGFQVAAAERGQEVVVSLHETFAVGRRSIIPSVVFHLSIPDSFEGSWYTGKVVVGLKDAVFRHLHLFNMQLNSIACCLLEFGQKHPFSIYSDDGPDHRLTYISATP